MTKLKFISVLCFLFIGSACFNANGAHHRHAESEAKIYAQKVQHNGGDLQFVSCVRHDTDGDGYLACSFTSNGQVVTLDCAGQAVLFQNHGCKEYVAKMRRSANVQIHGTH
jgi:hypothetical protein